MPSDSSYAAATRHRRPLTSKAGRPPVLELVDDQWAADKLSDDEVEVGKHEADAGGFEEGELDADSLVSPTGNSASAANCGTFEGGGIGLSNFVIFLAALCGRCVHFSSSVFF